MIARAGLPGSRSEGIWCAPGRVNLIGDHTDYQEGLCLPMAIDRDCRVRVTRRADGWIRARSAQFDGTAMVASDGSTDPGSVEPEWGRFVAGAVQVVSARGADLGGLDLEISSRVPPGSGLSSSSALSVALCAALAELGGLDLDRTTLAHLALDAEVHATGVPGGLMDQLTALHAVPGHALLLDCRTRSVQPVPIPRSVEVVVVHSGRARALAKSGYAARRAECETVAAALGLPSLRDATLSQVRQEPRARHVVTENARVTAFATAMRTGDVAALGPLMLASHASLRDDFGVSTPELDATVERLVRHGALGARLTGAGFGGCVVALVPRGHADDVVARVVRATRTEAGIEPLAFAVRPGEPARRLTSGRGAPTSWPRTPPP